MHQISVYLTPLDEKVSSSSDEIGSVEAGLVLCGHKLALSSQLVSVLHRADGIVLSRRGSHFKHLSGSDTYGATQRAEFSLLT